MCRQVDRFALVAVRRACKIRLRAERKEAKERQAQAGGTAPGKLPEAVTTGRARDKSSRGTGYAARTLDKAAEIYRALLPDVKTDAKRRQSRKVSGTGEDTRDKLGAFVGKSGRTMEKQVALVEAAEAEPEKYGALVADMDRIRDCPDFVRGNAKDN